MHPNNILLFQKYAEHYFSGGQSVLEIGPDLLPTSFQKLVGSRCKTWDTVDIEERPGLTYRCAEYSFPVESERYDVVFSAQVIEHVRKVWVWIKEVARVCKPGGLIIIINPVSWPYHAIPVDCWRIYPEGMRALFDEASIEVILSLSESLENPKYRRYIPGVSEFSQGKRRFVYRLLGPLGYPVERAYDTITIGRKPIAR